MTAAPDPDLADTDLADTDLVTRLTGLVDDRCARTGCGSAPGRPWTRRARWRRWASPTGTCSARPGGDPAARRRRAPGVRRGLRPVLPARGGRAGGRRRRGPGGLRARLAEALAADDTAALARLAVEAVDGFGGYGVRPARTAGPRTRRWTGCARRRCWRGCGTRCAGGTGPGASPTGSSRTRSGGASRSSGGWSPWRRGAGPRNAGAATRSPVARSPRPPTGSTSCSSARTGWPRCAGRFSRSPGNWRRGSPHAAAGPRAAPSTCAGRCAAHCPRAGCR